MEFKEVMESESALTQPIRDQVAAFEERVNDYLGQLSAPQDDDEEEEEDLD